MSLCTWTGASAMIKPYMTNALHDKCLTEYDGCWDKCPTTADFDIDFEGAVVDKA